MIFNHYFVLIEIYDMLGLVDIGMCLGPSIWGDLPGHDIALALRSGEYTYRASTPSIDAPFFVYLEHVHLEISMVVHATQYLTWHMWISVVVTITLLLCMHLRMMHATQYLLCVD